MGRATDLKGCGAQYCLLPMLSSLPALSENFSQPKYVSELEGIGFSSGVVPISSHGFLCAQMDTLVPDGPPVPPIGKLFVLSLDGGYRRGLACENSHATIVPVASYKGRYKKVRRLLLARLYEKSLFLRGLKESQNLFSEA